MGLADLALGMQRAYGSEDFISITDTVMDAMANYAAQASALRAKELGTFPKYNFEKISNSKFYKEVYWPETKAMIEKYGLRNSRILSIAPTGSISNVLGVSGGVEPYFNLGYSRTIKSIYENERTIFVWEKTPQLLAKELKVKTVDELPDWAKVTSQNIPFEKRAKVQATIQKYVDTAISSTFNLNNAASLEDIINIYKTSWHQNLKGATVFRDRCKKIAILAYGDSIHDDNPAAHPVITVTEKWTNKKTGEVKAYQNTIEINDENYTSSKIETDICPECGAPLIKKGGCTTCSDETCMYAKCSI